MTITDLPRTSTVRGVVGPVLFGRTEPRVSTPPLVSGRPGPCGCGCALTGETSLGFEAVRFCTEILGIKPLPWQRHFLIHALELLPAGQFRFRTVLLLVARQSGKTALIKLLALFLMFTGRAPLVLGIAQSIDIARESWQGAVELCEDDAELRAEVSKIRHVNGEQTLTLVNGCRYRIAAANRSAGRGLSVDCLILDELREHRDWAAWSALSKTTTARPNSITFGISNAGDDQSVVLNSLRASALTGQDDSLGIFEWSAADGCDLDDRSAWAQANPGLGYTVSEQAIRSAMSTDPPAVFRTETLCQRVEALDAAIDGASWAMCADPAGSLAAVRSRVAVCLDVAPEGGHVTLCGAALLDDGRIRVEVLEAWESSSAARRELPGLLGKIAPAAICWYPSGPAAELGAELRALEAREIKGGEVSEACMEFSSLVVARRILHPSDELLDAHVSGTSKLRTGEGYRFARRGVGNVDAAYAAAGAVRLARTLPQPVKRVRSKVF